MGDREHFCGEFSRADIAMAPHLGGAAYLECGVDERHPALQAWVERVSQRASIAQATAELMEAFGWSRTDSDPFFSRDRYHFRDHRLEWAFRTGLGPWLVDPLEADRVFFSDVS